MRASMSEIWEVCVAASDAFKIGVGGGNEIELGSSTSLMAVGI